MPLKFVKNKIRKASGAIAEFGKQLGVETGSYKEGGQLQKTIKLSMNRAIAKAQKRFGGFG